MTTDKASLPKAKLHNPKVALMTFGSHQKLTYSTKTHSPDTHYPLCFPAALNAVAILIFVPGVDRAISASNSCPDFTGIPLNEVMTNPTFKPAFAAGPIGTTSVTTILLFSSVLIEIPIQPVGVTTETVARFSKAFRSFRLKWIRPETWMQPDWKSVWFWRWWPARQLLA